MYWYVIFRPIEHSSIVSLLPRTKNIKQQRNEQASRYLDLSSFGKGFKKSSSPSSSATSTTVPGLLHHPPAQHPDKMSSHQHSNQDQQQQQHPWLDESFETCGTTFTTSSGDCEPREAEQSQPPPVVQHPDHPHPLLNHIDSLRILNKTLSSTVTVTTTNHNPILRRPSSSRRLPVIYATEDDSDIVTTNESTTTLGTKIRRSLSKDNLLALATNTGDRIKRTWSKDNLLSLTQGSTTPPPPPSAFGVPAIRTTTIVPLKSNSGTPLEDIPSSRREAAAGARSITFHEEVHVEHIENFRMVLKKGERYATWYTEREMETIRNEVTEERRLEGGKIRGGDDDDGNQEGKEEHHQEETAPPTKKKLFFQRKRGTRTTRQKRKESYSFFSTQAVRNSLVQLFSCTGRDQPRCHNIDVSVRAGERQTQSNQ